MNIKLKSKKNIKSIISKKKNQLTAKNIKPQKAVDA